MRLLGYAQTAFRALVAVAVIALLARLAMKIGVLPGVSFVEDVPASTFAIVAGGLLALATLAEIVATLFAPRAAVSRRSSRLQSWPGG